MRRRHGLVVDDEKFFAKVCGNMDQLGAQSVRAISAATRALFSRSAMLAPRVAPWLRSDMRASKNGVRSRP